MKTMLLSIFIISGIIFYSSCKNEIQAQRAVEISVSRSDGVVLPADKSDDLEVLYPGNWTNVTQAVIYIVGPDGEDGYLTGTNVFDDLAKGQRFIIEEPCDVHGVLFWVGIMEGTSGVVDFCLWSFDGVPGEKIASVSVPVSEIVESDDMDESFYVAFDPPVRVENDFMAGIDMSAIGSSQIALYSTEDGEGGELGHSWEKWSDGKWYTFLDPDGWDIDIDLAIFPLVSYPDSVPVVPELLVTAVVNKHVSCFGGSDGQATATATGGVEPYTWLWSDGQTTQAATGLPAGTFQVTVTDSEGHTAATNVTITQPAQLTVTATGTNITTHGGNDGTATADVSGGTAPYAYLWSDSAAQTTQTANSLVAGTYQVTVTDANGCTANTSIALTQPDPVVPELSVTASVISHVACFGGSNGQATATATGGVEPYTWLWSDGQTTQAASGLPAGAFQVTVTDSEGHTATTNITITQPAQLTVTATGTNITTHGGSDGTATAHVSGGIAPYAYLWSDSAAQTTQTANNLVAGTYQVTVTDANGCSANTSITLTQPDPVVPELSVTASVISHVACFGGSDGQAAAEATGGKEPYTWLWSDGQQTDVVYNLVAGTHQVTLTDDLGNTAQAEVTITEPSPLEVVLTTTNPTTYDGSNGTAVASVSGGTSPYTYLWTDPGEQQTQTITGLAAGTYMLAVTDSNGCTAIAMATLTSPDPYPNITYDALAIRFTSGAVEIIPMDEIRIMQFDFATAVDDTSVPVSTMMAVSNYPNPFSGTTTIEFELARPGHVDIMIYDVTGRSIRRLMCPDCAAGSNRLEWNGRDDGGGLLHSGVYMVRLIANDQVSNHRMLLVR